MIKSIVILINTQNNSSTNEKQIISFDINYYQIISH